MHSDSCVQTLRVSAHQHFRGYREADCSVFGQDDSSGGCLISVEGYRATAISNLEAVAVSQEDSRCLSCKIEWLPDWTILTNEEAATYCRAAADDFARPIQKDTEQVERACLHLLTMALLEVQANQTLEPKAEYLRRYLGWAQRQKDRFHNKTSSRSPYLYSCLEDSHQDDNNLADLRQNVAWQLYKTVGERLSRILRGEIDALDLLMGGSLLETFYSGTTFAASYKMLAAYIGLLAHKNPDLKILEVGAGTGGATTFVLDEIAVQSQGESKTLRCGQYVYTDVSPGFFEAAKDRFRVYEDKMMFRALDIEKDTASQGLETEYDVVIAVSVSGMQSMRLWTVY